MRNILEISLEIKRNHKHMVFNMCVSVLYL